MKAANFRTTAAQTASLITAAGVAAAAFGSCLAAAHEANAASASGLAFCQTVELPAAPIATILVF